MPKTIVRKKTIKEKEKTAKLETVLPGTTVRFAEIAFEMAVSENQFFIVGKPIEIKEKDRDKEKTTEKRIRLLGFDGSMSERDPDRLVVEHECIVEVKPSPDPDKDIE